VNSPNGGSTLGEFDGQALKTLDNTITGNIGRLAVAAPMPLPAALPLFGTGLGILGLIAWPRARKGDRRRAR